MPGILEDLLSRVVAFLEREGVEYMVIGGFALPSYGPIRTTVDLDVAVRIKTAKEFVSFVARANKSGFKPATASFSNPVSVFTDSKTNVEVEFWLRPDGIEWDADLGRRRRKTKIGRVSAWLAPPEDFIVSKLSRPDRGVQDEKDVKGVLTRLQASIDRNYLDRRAKKAGVAGLLRAIEDA